MIEKIAQRILEKIAKEKVTLKPHQARALAKLQSGSPGLLVYHGLGSGKTLTALKAREALGPALFITPAGLRENMLQQASDFRVNVAPEDVISYNKAMSSPPEVDDPRKLVIVDEAHNLGTPDTQRSKLLNKYPLRGKTMLLTGTPIRNHPHELAALINAVHNEEVVPKHPALFNEMFIRRIEKKPSLFESIAYAAKAGETYDIKNAGKLRKLVRGVVDYHPHDPNNPDFPTVEESYIKVPMSPKQEQVYENVTGKMPPGLRYKMQSLFPPGKSELRSLNAFLQGARQSANNPLLYDSGHVGSGPEDQTKIQAAFESFKSQMAKNPKLKAVIYSNYLDSGLNPYRDRLVAGKIPHAMITGEVNPQLRAEAVKSYNRGKLNALLLSGAGSEGLDLKGTNLMQVLEPHWNAPRIEQAIGRGVRYRSHTHLNPEDRKVMVEHYLSTYPKRTGIRAWAFGSDPEKKTADEYLKFLSDKKKELNNKFLKILQEEGSR